MLSTVVKVHDEVVREKLLKAAPHILAKNRGLVQAMLDTVKPAVVGDTPEGPGHFGYHGRDTVKVEVSSSGVKTTGKLKAARQLYWREYGTGMRHRARGKAAVLRQSVRVMTGSTGGEPALMVANKALSGVKRFIKAYYNGMANWWSS